MTQSHAGIDAALRRPVTICAGDTLYMEARAVERTPRTTFDVVAGLYADGQSGYPEHWSKLSSPFPESPTPDTSSRSASVLERQHSRLPGDATRCSVGT
jgi:hypothetical protein